MKFVVDNWMWILLALTSGGMLLWQALGSGAAAGGVTPTEAVLLVNREKAVLIDVCEPAEYAAGHAAQAKSVPLSRLEQSLPAVVKNKSTPVILVCASGVRSRRAVSIAQKLGYERAVSLAGGLRAWREAGLPVERTAA